MPRVADSKNGAFRVAIEANREAMVLFSKSDQNRMLRTASLSGAELFVDRDLFRRFSRWAIGALGAFTSAKWRKYKTLRGGVDVPFVGLTPIGGGPPAPNWKQQNGEKMNVAIRRGARATAVAKNTDATATIRLPFGHALRPETAKRFATLTTKELREIGEEQARVLAAILNGAPPANAKHKRTLAGAASVIAVNPRPAGRAQQRAI